MCRPSQPWAFDVRNMLMAPPSADLPSAEIYTDLGYSILFGAVRETPRRQPLNTPRRQPLNTPRRQCSADQLPLEPSG
eukprot:7231891-Prymnesium_polylepis.3